jgi:hypothetical protein
VALSAGGNTALIGGPDENAGAGAAWIFTRSAGAWKQQGAKLSGSADAGFGWSVALSAGGNVALIGGPSDNGGAGAAWVFTRSDGSWSEKGAVLAGGDGEPVAGLIGFWRGVWKTGSNVDGEDGVGIEIDRRQANGGFTGTLDFRIGRGPGELKSAMSGMITPLAGGASRVDFTAGTPGDPSGGPTTFSGTTTGHGFIDGTLTSDGVALPVDLWILGSEEGPAQFGFSVALSANGTTALVGGAFDNSNDGAAWVFTRSGAVWTEQVSERIGSSLDASKLTSGREGAGGELGWSVALSADGNTALIGAPGAASGVALVFRRAGGVWKQQAPTLTGGDGSGTEFGHGVALSADGTAALVGSPQDTNAVGTARVFTVHRPLTPALS